MKGRDINKSVNKLWKNLTVELYAGIRKAFPEAHLKCIFLNKEGKNKKRGQRAHEQSPRAGTQHGMHSLCLCITRIKISEISDFLFNPTSTVGSQARATGHTLGKATWLAARRVGSSRAVQNPALPGVCSPALVDWPGFSNSTIHRVSGWLQNTNHRPKEDLRLRGGLRKTLPEGAIIFNVQHFLPSPGRFYPSTGHGSLSWTLRSIPSVFLVRRLQMEESTTPSGWSVTPAGLGGGGLWSGLVNNSVFPGA